MSAHKREEESDIRQTDLNNQLQISNISHFCIDQLKDRLRLEKANPKHVQV